LLGPHAAVIAMTGVLVIQCLIFQDGGLLALGANIINMGILPAYIGYGIWRMVIGRPTKLTLARLIPATWVAAFVAVTIGAAAVCLEVALADRLAIPLAKFSAAMVGVHMISGAIEGTITCFVLIALYRAYPDLSPIKLDQRGPRLELRSLVAALGLTAVVIAAALSWLASPYADGLEWAIYEKDYGRKQTIKPPDRIAESTDQFQQKYSLLPDYDKRSSSLGAPDSNTEQTETGTDTPARWPEINLWTSLSGLIGIALTMVVVHLAAKTLLKPRQTQPGG